MVDYTLHLSCGMWSKAGRGLSVLKNLKLDVGNGVLLKAENRRKAFLRSTPVDVVSWLQVTTVSV